MKRWLILMLIVALAVYVTACGTSSELAVPDDSVFRHDVQDYITEILDDSATISIFEKTNSEVNENTLTVTCVAMYSGSAGESKGTFTLSYSNDGKIWTLEKCRVELEESKKPSAPAESEPIETETVPPQENTDTKPIAATEPGNYAYSLTQVGTISDVERELSIKHDAVFQDNGNAAKLLNYLGEEKNDIVISGLEYIGQGLYIVQDTSGDINSVGLVDQDGNVLIPCEACKIDWPHDMLDGAGRYLWVIYTTGETTNADECFIYATDYGWSFNRYQEDNTMYTGYAKVFDLKTERFVDNVKITNNDSYALQTCGNTFAIEDEERITKIYNDKGEVIFQTAHNVSVGAGTFIVSDNGTYRVYDENGNQTYTSNKALYLIDGNGGYIYKYENDRNVIMDRNGNQVAGGVFEYVYSEVNDVFKVKNNGKYGLVHADGTVILPCETYGGSISYIDFGLYNVTIENESGYTYALIGNNGVIADDLPSSITTYLKAIDGEKVFIVNEGEYTLTIEDEYPEVPVIGMLAAQSDSNGLYGVFDLFTGEQMLGYEYEVVKAAAGYLYAFKNGAWEVYQINGPVQ